MSDVSEASRAESRSTEIPAVPVVGIGASAGGLEAVKEMLSEVGRDCGIAFVLVQHLDPNHSSMMAELVGRATDLEVRQITHGEPVAPGVLHVIPPGSALSIEGGMLTLSDFEEPRGVRRPIDRFLSALAQDRHSGAAAVILSGTGADGAMGLRAIKEAGGVVAAQDPALARYDGMPMSAVATGLVDFVLPAGEIAERLAAYFERLRADDGTRRAATVVAEHVDDLCDAIRDLVGHDFSGYTRSTVIRRIERRMKVLGIDDAADYLARVRGDAEECTALFRDLLINVTCFFRDIEKFEALNDHVIAPIVASAGPSDPIRVWVPGCSSGQEAYTIAMLIDAECREQKRRRVVQIFATDIDDEMLAIAREGRYPVQDVSDIPERFREDCILGLEGQFVVAPHIRDMVRFSSHSIIKDPPFGRLDLVSCRNMLIYMGERIQSSLIPLFHYVLKPDRFLFLGPSESVSRHEDLFEAVDRSARIFRRSGEAPRRPVGLPIVLDTQKRAPVPTRAGPAARFGSSALAVRNDSDPASRRILASYAPPHVIVGRSGEVLSFGGQLARYLDYPDQESVSQLSRLARPGLREAIGPILREARETGSRQVRDGIAAKSEFGTQPLLLVADPLPDETILVLFLSDGRFREQLADEIGPGSEPDDPVASLEEELRHMRARLRLTVEELETANEELKSSNEEMMSMNEELQSANEELSTVNEELKNKLDELAVANDDMRNFLASTELAVVTVDPNMRIRSFTPPAADLLGLGELDIGSSLERLGRGLLDEGFVDDVAHVLESGEPAGRIVTARDGAGRLRMRILPYQARSGRQEGATLTFIDISNLIDLEDQLREQSERLALALMVSRMGVWGVDLETGTAELDDAVADLFGLDGGEGSYPADDLFDLIHPEDRETVRADYGRAIETGADFTGVFRVKAPGTQDGIRWIKGIGRRVDQPGVKRIVGINYDISDEQRASALNTLLLREMDHRVKNLFAVIAAMVGLAARTHTEVQPLVRDVRSRIEALSRAHEITKGRESVDAVAMGDLVKMILTPYDDGSRIAFSGPDLRVATRMVTPLGLVLHEWATNASKYGAFSEGGGQVRIEWAEGQAEGETILTWNESGGPEVVRPIGTGGFGSRLVEISAQQMNGTVETDYTSDGFSGRIRIVDDADFQDGDE